MKILSIILFSFTTMLYANDLDHELRAKAQRFGIKALTKIQDTNPELTAVGHRLFHDVILSRNDNIACIHCHHPRLGTSDNLPLSIGEGARGMGTRRVQTGDTKLTRRHATHLINKGHPEFTHMFWDGRVEREKDGTWNTPEPALNGKYPTRKDIADQIKSPISMQAIFPIADNGEMFGRNNEGFSTLEKWDIIAKKVISKSQYEADFKKIFNVNSKDFHIGYIGEALGHFQKNHFQVTNTRWDKFLAGDNNALTKKEKLGASIFLNKGRCVTCHNGPHMGGQNFDNSAAPQLIFSATKNDDLGRFEVTKNPRDKYMFRVAPLRGLRYTAPYFHNGVFQSLEEVVEHYNNPYKSLREFNTQIQMSNYTHNYVERFSGMSEQQIQARLKRLPHFYRHHGSLGLSLEEKDSLVEFLKTSLAR